MKPASFPAHSARNVEYLKGLFYRGGTVRTSETAPAFHVGPSTTGKTLMELTTVGYIPQLPFHGVCLTDSAGDHAECRVTRHRILSLIFVRYGPSGEPACREVSRCGSLVRKGEIDTLCRATGDLLQGVCGETTHDDGCVSTTRTGNRGVC